ncbi:hypothetical protein [Cupriavidus basilensis]|uniref:Nucleotide modification associated domain-containing protein n=1 Tax=Cupriavidus basilensis TaxID=68895 RepID=A0A643FJQ9_9BURK|nr:hypothetical protein [Cupriavidus basilensis]QOT82073.1 hypothetical protein F7R26_037960 [Cupriavidus basilensis]
MARVHSYVVRYDSGFAPNPFYGHCTLATCKPGIRRSAQVGDWVIGCGSNAQGIRRGGHIVYAMRVSEALTFDQYSADPRFLAKMPFRNGSRKQSSGDNIYHRQNANSEWFQRDSFHSNPDGTTNYKHVRRDTSVNRVLLSDDYVYFGGIGPKFPIGLRDRNGRPIWKSGIGVTCFDDAQLLAAFERWLRGLAVIGYQGAPFEWLTLRG